jgi:arylsulfatase A-like enzyme
MTGQYGHNNGVLSNKYANLIDKENVLPAWLQQAGYKTALVGKFLNGYERFASPTQPPPGWNRSFVQLAPRGYYNWSASKNGRLVSFGAADSDHVTDVTGALAATWTEGLAAGDKPFFLQASFFAPHAGPSRVGGDCSKKAPTPSPQDAGAFSGVSLPESPAFNEADVTDKPSAISKKPLLDAAAIEVITRRYRCVLESLLGVDRGIRAIHDAVAAAGELDRTVFIFTADNGYFHGEHRIAAGKVQPYEENLRLPLAISAPAAYRGGVPAAGEVSSPAANIDLAPTILELAGGQPCAAPRLCRVMDGISLMPRLAGDPASPARSFMVERFGCSYRGVRVDHQVLFEHLRRVPGGRCEVTDTEHYDLDLDPHQLQNAYGVRPTRFQLEAQALIGELADCAGIRGRDPLPASGHYCG